MIGVEPKLCTYEWITVCLHIKNDTLTGANASLTFPMLEFMLFTPLVEELSSFFWIYSVIILHAH